MNKIPLLLLAAGSSTRMGQPKQLLPWGKVTLIEHQIQTLLKIKQQVIVVLGSNTELIIPVIEKFSINIVNNKHWKNGMGSSIAVGVNSLAKEFPQSNGLLITLIDQPLLTTSHFEKMLRMFQPGNQQIIVSCSLSGQKGVPALFDKYYFEKLKNLKGQEGGKSIIQQHKNRVFKAECGEILEDIDTPESYQRMMNRFF